MVIFTFIYDFAHHILPDTTAMHRFAYNITLLFGLLTPIANPILYSWLNENFRSAFREKCCCFLSLKPQQTPTLRDESHFVTVQGTETLGTELGEFNIAIRFLSVLSQLYNIQ